MPYTGEMTCSRCGVTGECQCQYLYGYHPRYRQWIDPFWEKVKKMKERIKASGTPAGIPGMAGLAECPLLWDMLTSDMYEGGKRRKRSTMLLMADGCVMKALLIDKDLGEQAWFAAESFDGVLLAIEEALTTGAVQWQPAKPPGNGRSR